MNESSKSLFFDRLAANVLIVVLGLLPFFFIPFLAVSVEVSKAYFLGLGASLVLILWVVARMIEGRITFPRTPVLLALVAFLIASVISAVFSPAPHVSFGDIFLSSGTIISIATLFLVFLASVLYINTPKKVQLLVQILFVVSAIVAILEIGYLFLGPRFLSLGILYSNTSNVIGKWNDLSVWFGLVIFGIMMIFEFVPMNKMGKIFSGVLLVLSVFLLALVNFTLVWGLLAVASLFMFVYSLIILRKEGEESKNHFPLIPFILLIISLFFFLANPIGGNFLSSKFGILQTEIRPSIPATISVIGQTLKDHPLIGVGPNRFVNAWYLYQPQSVIQTQFWNSAFDSGFGLIPTLFVTTGILGGLSIIIFLLLFLIAGFVHAFSPTGDRKSHFYFLSTFLMAVFGWIIALLYNPGIVSITAAFAFSGIYIGLLYSSGRLPTKDIRFLRDPRQSFFAIAGLVIVLLGSVYFLFVGGEKFLSLSYFARAEASARQSDLPGAQNFLSHAIALTPSDLYYRSNTALAQSAIEQLLGNSKLSSDIVKSEFQSSFTFAETNARAAIAYNHTDPENWINLESLYVGVLPLGVGGAYDSAKAALDEVAKLTPKNPNTDYLRAELELSNKNPEGAKADLVQALSKKPNYTDALVLLAQIESSNGDTTGAIAGLEEAIMANPREATLYFELGLLKYDAGDYQGSISALERTATLDSSILNADYFLGLAYAKAGRTDDARSVFLALQKIAPTNQDIPKILANLDAGKDPLSGLQAASVSPSPGASLETSTPPTKESGTVKPKKAE